MLALLHIQYANYSLIYFVLYNKYYILTTQNLIMNLLLRF